MMSKYKTRLGDIGMLEHIEDKITPEHFENHLTTPDVTVGHFNGVQIPKAPPAISSYTSGSKDVNNALWKNKADGINIADHLVRKIHEIHAGLDASKPSTDDMTVYSGIRRDPQEMTKESGGLLHHPAFISSSINPSNALSFALPTDKKEVHVLKIKIRKGQRVGGYLGDRSNIPGEQEYLIKSNQMLHIHPEPDRHEVKGNDGAVIKTVFIHHAIVMDPHEYEHLGEHAEVKKHKEMSSTLVNTAVDESKKHVDEYMNNNFGKNFELDKQFLHENKLSSTHIDKALEHPELHSTISDSQELEPHHIDKLINSKSGAIIANLTKQKNLTPDHVDYFLKKNNYHVTKGLLDNKNITLEPHHIDHLISGLIHEVGHRDELTPDHIAHLIKHRAELETVSKRSDLLPHHIDALIKNSKGDMYEDSIKLNLSANPNLTHDHIDKLIEHNSRYGEINGNLARRDNLSTGNIDRLLDSKNEKADRALSFRKDLTPDHVNRLVDNSINSDNYHSPMILRNMNNNYKIGHDMVKKVLANHKMYPYGLLDHVVHKQSGGDISQFKDTEYVQNHYKPLKESFSNLIVCRYW